MKQIDWMIWILLLVVLGYSWHRQGLDSSRLEDDCQTYDQMGHGIGCEGPDITDRM
jgi:hypothetical protein